MLDYILHVDKYLDILLLNYGLWVYAFLFLIIFAETGLVATPFLPGDSLLFAVGAIAARGTLDVIVVLILLIVAAILGDTVNYWIGNSIGKKAFSGQYKFFKREYLEKTEKFYEKYGVATIILARFVPIIRTFAPFVAGIGNMKYSQFLLYNVVGGAAWVLLFVLGGYFFGNIQFVQDNFGFVVIGIIVVSLIPAVVGYLQAQKS